MSLDRSLLPPGYPRYGRAVDEAAARLADTPVPIADLWNPAAIRADLLPFLAWGLDVDIWDENWSIEKKRSIVAASFAMHFKKGTLGGIRQYVEAVDAELLRAFVPPGKSFLSPSLSREEREAALADLPQIRLFDWIKTTTSASTFWGDFSGEFMSDESGPTLFTLETTADERMAQIATYFDEGVSTPLTREREDIQGGGTIDRIYLPPVPRLDAVFSGDPIGRAGGLGGFFMPSRAAERVITLNLQDVSASERVTHLFPIVPSFEPINTAPDHVAELGFAPASVFSGDAFGGGSFMGEDFFVPSTASRRLYNVVYLRDASRPSMARTATSFMGDDRFGMPAYTAELQISTLGTRPPWVAGEFIYGFFVASDHGNLDFMLDAVVRSKARRDKVLVNPTTYRPATVGTPLYLGTEIILGAYTRS